MTWHSPLWISPKMRSYGILSPSTTIMVPAQATAKVIQRNTEHQGSAKPSVCKRAPVMPGELVGFLRCVL